MRFREVTPGEDTLGVATDENHLVVRWSVGKVYFSYARKGDALSAHFSCGKESLRDIRKAIDEFCAWAFEQYPWCRMMIAAVRRKSVVKLVESCDFHYLTTWIAGSDGKESIIFVRLRHE